MSNGVDAGVQLILTPDEMAKLLPEIHWRVTGFVNRLVPAYAQALNWPPQAVAVVLAKVLFEHACNGLLAPFVDDRDEIYRRINAARDTLIEGLEPKNEN